MVQIEIEDPKKALEIVSRLGAGDFVNADFSTDTECYVWLSDFKNKIEAAILKEAETTWKQLSSFNREGVYAEINEFGEVRVGDKIYKPEFDIDFNAYATKWTDQLGEEHAINPFYFVVIYFNKTLEL